MKTMAISLKPGIVLLFLGILLVPCSARLSHYSEQNFAEPLRRVGEWSNRIEQVNKIKYYSNALELWNASWPTIVQQKHESILQNGFPESEERPFNLSEPCIDDLRRFGDGIFATETWALKMLDATGKLPSGLLMGNLKWVGMYRECLDVSSKQSNAQQLDNSTVLGEYCLVDIGANSSDASAGFDELFGVQFGICIPRRCSSTDAKAMINLVLSEFTDEISATEANCADDSPLPIDSGAAVVITVLCILGTLLLLGTSLDVFNRYRHQLMVVEVDTADDKKDDGDESPLVDGAERINQHKIVVPNHVVQNHGTSGCLYRFLIAFSVLANAKSILSSEPPKTNRNLQALNGMRFLSMSWVILGHTYMFGIPPSGNVLEYFRIFKRFSFQAIFNADVSVDTFFVLSGTLGSYFLLKDIQSKNGPRNIGWGKFYFHRFWRLTPMYMLVLAIYATLFKYSGSGPYWSKESDPFCPTSWWTNLLYINNIVYKESPCMGWSWYLANDMQFFVLSPIFIILLYKSALLGGIVTFVFMLASSITTGVLTYVNNYPPASPGMLQDMSKGVDFFLNIYFVPWCRINTYLVGILLGYVLFKSNCKLRIHKALVVLLWCLAAVCNLSVLYGLYNVANGHYLSPSVSAVYASLHRPAWAIGLSWVILACATGNGGFVNKLLSLPVMLPLSRLTYGAYLVQQMLILWYFQSLKVPFFVDDITMVYLFLGNLVVSYFCAFLVSIVIEAPMINLERSFLRSHGKKD